MPVLRIDEEGSVLQVERLQSGIRATASITRVGVFTYRNQDGTVTKEFRSPEEVFAADSLATLRGVPVTDEHPSGLVTPDSWRKVAKGHVGDDVRVDADLVVASIVVNDAAEIALIEAGKRRDVSAGYLCEIDPTPGTWRGEAYDRVQRNIRYNHAALLEKGAGRAGVEVGLRVDGADSVAVQVRLDAADGAAMKTITFNGRTYRTDSADDMAALQKDLEKHATDVKARTDADTAAASAKIDAVQKALADAMATVAQLQAELKTLQEATKAADGAAPPPSEEAMDAAIVVREKLRADAASVLGADVFGEKGALKGKPSSEIRAAVVAKLMPTMKLDAKDAKGNAVYDEKTQIALFDAAVAGFNARRDGKRNDALSEALRGTAGAGGTGAGEQREDSIEKAHQDAMNEQMKRGLPPQGSK